jgi:4a-hydroxytetrahydrobiopterin dehydratase
MDTPSAQDLTQKSCTPCEGGAEPLTGNQVAALLPSVSGWELKPDGKRLRRTWTAKGFMAAIDFFNKVAALAEREGHHPDLHLEGYRHVTIELWTHAIGGLSENDFIVAAKINEIPIAVRRH